MKSVIIYSTPVCPYCTKTKEWLKAHNIAYQDINVAADDKSAQDMVRESGQAGVPVWKVLEEGKVKRIVIGYDIDALEEEFKS